MFSACDQIASDSPFRSSTATAIMGGGRGGGSSRCELGVGGGVARLTPVDGAGRPSDGGEGEGGEKPANFVARCGALIASLGCGDDQVAREGTVALSRDEKGGALRF
jgi:hypothetical protein